MARKKAENVVTTDTKRTKREELAEKAKSLNLEFQENVTVKQLQALIKTEKLKADLPAPPPPPPALKVHKTKDGTIKVKVEPGKGARVLQGRVVEKGEDEWVDLCVISPPGAPNISIAAKKKVKKLRLMLNNEVLETAKV